VTALDISTVLQFLAFLSIGLMSVTIPTYAISISYLSRESESTLRDLRRRREQLSEKLGDLGKRLKEEPSMRTTIKAEIAKSETEEKQLTERLFSLSYNGAVVHPLAAYLLSLGFCVYGTLYPPTDPWFLLLPIAPIVYALYRLQNTLQAVETGALRPEEELLPRFKIAFKDGRTNIGVQTGNSTNLEVGIHNIGPGYARGIDFFLAFPPDFTIPEPTNPDIRIGEQAFDEVIRDVNIKGYLGVWSYYERIPQGVSWGVVIPVTPTKKGTYKVPSVVYSEKTEPTTEILIVEVS